MTNASATKTGRRSGTAEKPWELRTPPGTAEYQAYCDDAADPPALVVQVGKTQLRYHLRATGDLHAMLVAAIARDASAKKAPPKRK